MNIPDAPDTSTPRTVVSLTVDSYKRILAASLTPNETGVVLVQGRNEAGKSSLIESMLDVLGVEKSKMPITEGEHGSEVVLDLGDLIARKRWTRDSGGKAKASLTIEGADGSNIKSPAAVMESLRGRFADPVAFLKLKPDEQVETVLRVLGLDEQLEQLDKFHANYYDKRRDIGRDVDRIGKAVAEVAQEVDGLPVVDNPGVIHDWTRQLQEAKDHNAAMVSLTDARGTAEVRGREAAARLERLKLEVTKLEDDIRIQREAWTAANGLLHPMNAIELQPIIDTINGFEASAKADARRELLQKMQGEHADAQKLHADADAGLELTRTKIAELLGSAPFPVDGMAYDHEAKVLTINGIPFQQGSQAQRLKAAAAIAMAGSPSIRVLFAREGSLLDDESRVQLAQLADAAGFQLWLEIVASTPEGSGVWIEDGEATQLDGGA